MNPENLVKQRKKSKNILLVECTVTSALGILGMVYGFRRKEEENQAKDGQ